MEFYFDASGKAHFPGWRHMRGYERRNAKMHAMFERARQQGVTGLYSGPDPLVNRLQTPHIRF